MLITGGAGFIGANLAARLIGREHHVTIFDNLSRRGAVDNLAWLEHRHARRFRFLRGDVRDREAVTRAVDGAEIVYHLAAQAAVTSSVSDPRADFEVNALGTLNLLEAARSSGSDPIVVHASTNKVYGELVHLGVVEGETRYTFSNLPGGVAEDQPLDFHSPYGCSKGAADQYVRDYHRIYGLRTIVFRQSCIYGPRQMGVEDQGWVAWFAIASLTGRPLTIYGNGKQVRDLLYIDDLLEAFERAVAHIDRTAGQIYNIGGGPRRAVSVWREFAPRLAAALGHAVPEPAFADWRPGDQRVFYCDISKAARDFGWQPRIALDEGLRRLVAWARANRALFEAKA